MSPFLTNPKKKQLCHKMLNPTREIYLRNEILQRSTVSEKGENEQVRTRFDTSMRTQLLKAISSFHLVQCFLNMDCLNLSSETKFYKVSTLDEWKNNGIIRKTTN